MSDQEPVSLSAISNALTAASTPLVLVDADGTIEAANDALAPLVGFETGAALAGREMFTFTVDPALARRHLEEVVSGSMEAALVRTQLCSADGTTRPVTIWWRRLTTDAGVRGLIVVATPEPGSAAAPEPPAHGWLALVATDHDWRVTDVTADAVELLGGPGPPVGEALLGLVHPLDVADCVAALGRLDDEVRTITVGVRLRRNGEWSPCTVTVTRLCRHLPPRVACLVWPTPTTAATASGRLNALLEQRETGHLLTAVGHAIDRFGAAHELSAQELEIVARSVRGQGAQEIADAMYLSDGTVRNMLSALYRKFGVRSQLAMVAEILHE